MLRQDNIYLNSLCLNGIKRKRSNDYGIGELRAHGVQNTLSYCIGMSYFGRVSQTFAFEHLIRRGDFWISEVLKHFDYNLNVLFILRSFTFNRFFLYFSPASTGPLSLCQYNLPFSFLPFCLSFSSVSFNFILNGMCADCRPKTIAMWSMWSPSKNHLKSFSVFILFSLFDAIHFFVRLYFFSIVSLLTFKINLTV